MDIFRSALSLVIHKNANVSDRDVSDLLDYYRSRKGISIDKDRYRQALTSAYDHYNKHDTTLFICTDKSCLKKTIMSPSDDSIAALAAQVKCPVEITGCHWQCDEAPVVTVKMGSSKRSFVRCSSDAAWQTIHEFVLAHQQKQYGEEDCLVEV